MVNNRWTLMSLIVLLLIGAGALLAWRLRRKLLLQRARIEGLIDDVNGAKDQLNPFKYRVRGLTEDMVERMNDELTGALSALGQWRDRAAARHIIPLRRARSGAAFVTMTEALDSLAAAAEKSAADIRRITDTEREARRLLSELAAQSASLRTEIALLSKTASFPLDVLFDKTESLDAEIMRAEGNLPNDPVAAGAIARECLSALGALIEDMDDFPQYLDQYYRFEAAAAECRSRLDEIRETAGIGRAVQRLNPYANFGLARDTVHRMHAELQRGDVGEARRLGAEADRLLAEAVELAAAQAGLKDAVLLDLQRLLHQAAVLKDEIADLEKPFERIRSEYAVIHWSALLEKFRQAKEDAAEAEMLLAEAARLSSGSEQQFEHAQAVLDRLTPLLAGGGQTVAECGETFRGLRERLEACRSEIAGLEESFRQTLRKADEEALMLAGEAERLRACAAGAGRKGRELAEAAPVHLDAVELKLDRFRQETGAFQAKTELAAADKAQALRLIEEATLRYGPLSAASRGRINERHYSRRFNALKADAGRLMACGCYTEARMQAEDLADLVERMNHDYENALAGERRSRLLEQRRLRCRSADCTLDGGVLSGGTDDFGVPETSGGVPEDDGNAMEER